MKISKFVPHIFVLISIFASVADAANAIVAFTHGQSWEREGIIFLIRYAIAILLAMASWACPIAARTYWLSKKRGAGLFLGTLAIFFTIVNMLNAKAYTGDYWTPNKYVGGPMVISVPYLGTIYQTQDWYLDMISYIPPLTLLSIVAVNLEEKEEESPEEYEARTNRELKIAEINKLRREKLDPLKAEAATDLGKGIRSGIGGFAKGLGINLPEKPKAEERPTNEVAPVQPEDDETPEEAAIPVAATYEVLPPTEIDVNTVVTIVGVSKRAVRDWCLKESERFGARKVTVGQQKKWVMSVEAIKHEYPKQYAQWERRRKMREANQLKRRHRQEQPDNNITNIA